jgi:hypothetical protein
VARKELSWADSGRKAAMAAQAAGDATPSRGGLAASAGVSSLSGSGGGSGEIPRLDQAGGLSGRLELHSAPPGGTTPGGGKAPALLPPSKKSQHFLMQVGPA